MTGDRHDRWAQLWTQLRYEQATGTPEHRPTRQLPAAADPAPIGYAGPDAIAALVAAVTLTAVPPVVDAPTSAERPAA